MVKKYEPSPDVVAAHSIAHADPVTGAPVENPTFQPSLIYVMSLIRVPVILFAFAVLCLTFLFLYTQCRCLFCCCKPKPQVLSEEDVEKQRVALEAKKTKVTYVCYFWIFVIFITDCFIWLGNTSLTKALADVADAIDELLNFFMKIIDGVKITSDGAGFLEDVTSTDASAPFSYCKKEIVDLGLSDSLDTALIGMSTACGLISDLTAGMSDLAAPLTEKLNLASSEVDGAVGPKDSAIGLIFAAFLILCVLNLLVFIGVKKCGKWGSCLSWTVNILNYVILLLLFLVCCIVMILVMLFGDFCFDPAGSIQTTMGNSPTSKYYTECIGDNPFEDNVDQIKLRMADISGNLAQLSALNPNGNCIRGINNGTATLQTGIDQILDQTKCEPIIKVYDAFINQAFCTSGFSGLYQSWGDIYFMAFFYFWFLLSVGIYQGLPATPNSVVGVEPHADAVQMVSTHHHDSDHHHHKDKKGGGGSLGSVPPHNIGDI